MVAILLSQDASWRGQGRKPASERQPPAAQAAVSLGAVRELTGPPHADASADRIALV